MPVTIVCPTCKEHLPVPTEVVGTDPANGVVLVRMDNRELHAHYLKCAAERGDKDAAKVSTEVAKRPDTPTTAELSGRVDRVLATGAYIVPGNRFCSGCGATADSCLKRLRKGKSAACCGMCHDGNTHPTPGAQVDCQVWAAEHGPH